MPTGKSSKKAAEKEEEVNPLQKATEEFIRELSGKAPAKVAPHIKTAAPHIAKVVVYIHMALPHIIKACEKVQELAAKLPEKAIYAGLGFTVCFFGGVFPATIAAVEAWRLCGGTEAYTSAKKLYEEVVKAAEASKEDDKKDTDNDGTPDVKQLEPKDLVIRKVNVVMEAVDPEVVSSALVNIYTGWIGVLGVLKIQFAKTVTLGERIGEQLYGPASRFEAKIEGELPEEYRKWVPVAVRWACKIAAMTLAWWLTRVISAFHSAIRGGLVFGKNMVDILHEKNVLKFSSEKAHMDEMIGWVVALVGLVFQFSIGFSVPFPLWLVLWPVQLVEAFIVWSIAVE